MKRLFTTAIVSLILAAPATQAKDLVAYFSAEGHTKAVAERIAELTGADIYRIEAADPYAANPYDDSDRIQNEAYNDLRPAVANPPSQEWLNQYDRIYIGSPCWWHQPAMVVCTFLETYDLSNHIIIPFFTYGATTYLNESMQKIYKCTPNSVHIPETLPEDLDADDITRPGRPDDAGIDMPGNANGVEGWLNRLGLLGNSGITTITGDTAGNMRVYTDSSAIHVEIGADISSNTVEVYNLDGKLLHRMSNRPAYSFPVTAKSVYLLSMTYDHGSKRINKKLILQ